MYSGVSLPALGENKHQAKSREDEKQVGLEIMTAMQETVPRPDVLGDGIGDQDDSRQKYQESANPRVKRAGAESSDQTGVGSLPQQ